jgi:hypothetical protein
MKRRILALTLGLAWSSAFGGVSDEPPEGFMQRHPALRTLAENLDFTWAKQILDADMDLMEELLSGGLLSDREADWYVVLPGGDGEDE